MRIFSYLFLLLALIGFLLCIVVRLFFHEGIFGLGPSSFYAVTFLSLFFVIAISLMRSASK